MGVHVSHHPEPASHLPRHPIPLDCLRASALSALLHASNLQWSSILYMIIYMFQCYSLILSHPCLLPHSPKVCSLHLCLFCCLAYRVVVTIFLNSIYMHLVYCIGVSLSGLLHSIIGSSFIYLIRTDSYVFFLYSWVIFHCVYEPKLPYPLIYQWASRLLPCPIYCKQCCDEHWGTHVSFNSGFLGVYVIIIFFLHSRPCWCITPFSSSAWWGLRILFIVMLQQDITNHLALAHTGKTNFPTLE